MDRIMIEMRLFMNMMAKPKSIGVVLLNGGELGSVFLHPNQKWKALFKDDKDKVGLERDNLSLIIDKDFFEEWFSITL